MQKGAGNSSLTWFTYGAALLAALGLLFVFSLDEYRSWRSEEARSEQTLSQASDALARHVDDSVQVARVALGDILTAYRNNRGDPQLGFKIRKMMLGQLASAPLLESLSAIDASGHLIAISTNSFPSDVDFTSQDYFRHHLETRGPSLFIATPTKSRLDGNWVMTISRRIDDERGNFEGVVVATFTTSYFTTFFQNFNLGSDAIFLMLRADGLVLSREPYDGSLVGQSIAQNPLFTENIGKGPTGILYYTSPIDNRKRIGAFRHSERTGIVVLTAASVSNIFSRWADVGLLRWITMFGVLLLSGLSILGWMLQLKRRRLSEAQIGARESEFRLLAEASTDLIERLDLDGKRLYVSPASTELIGLEPDAMTGTHVLDTLDKTSARAVAAALAKLRSGSEIERAVTRRSRADGRTLWTETTFKRVSHGSGSSIISVTRDITAYKLQQDQLTEMAHSDPLTGLANRRAFDMQLEKLAQESVRRGKDLSLLMIDVDRFKQFNDLYGHGAGDACLQSVAESIKRNLRGTDLGVRYGGEEFAAVLANTGPEKAYVCAERIRTAIEALAITHSANEPGRVVTASVGIATWKKGETIAEFIGRADACLYMAKQNGRNLVASEPCSMGSSEARFGT